MSNPDPSRDELTDDELDEVTGGTGTGAQDPTLMATWPPPGP